jgi:hypothetical protein
MSVRFTQEYRPLYFLSALGAGGLSVSFFMYLMFLVKHPATPIPTVEDLASVYRNGSTPAIIGVTLVLTAIAGFALQHLRLLAANLVALRRFTRAPAHDRLRESNAEVQLLAVPLTLAMTVNVLFIVAALSIPGLWDVVEYLFPVALVTMSAIGVHALVLFGRYLTRILTRRAFDLSDANHFSQLLPSMAFTMIAVGFSSSAAMSQVTATSLIGILGTFVFAAAALAWAALAAPVSVHAILRNGLASSAAPTLWIGIPILTLLGIATVRVTAGISHTIAHTQPPAVLLMVVLGLFLAAQVVIGLAGWATMHRQGYFANVVRGPQAQIPSYALICPGVAASVLAMFFLHWGLVKTGVLTPYSPTHLALLVPVAAIQAITVMTFQRINRKHLTRRTSAPTASQPSAHQSVPA